MHISSVTLPSHLLGILFCSKIMFAASQFASQFSHFLIAQIALLHSRILFCSDIMFAKIQFASPLFSHCSIVHITLLHPQLQNLHSTMLISGAPSSGFHQNCSCTYLCILAWISHLAIWRNTSIQFMCCLSMMVCFNTKTSIHSILLTIPQSLLITGTPSSGFHYNCICT